ncbi:MAG: DUF1592 domain-containing protein [Myxococcales bacterium]|nr:DUF1592 domain-containing protein [Myxococcales bacterium]MDD9969686.1 DUF1592 domain-containing protein [Myxococcales bacterium]
MHVRRLWVAGTLLAMLAGCGSDAVETPGDTPGGDPTVGAGSFDAQAPDGMAGNGGRRAAGMGANREPTGNPELCQPGVPATSQLPRLLNRQYDAVLRDLLGVTGVGAEGTPPSELLVADFDGPMTADAWRIYQDVGAQIARAVMGGPNRSRFIACDPEAAGCLEETIVAFGRRAFRRPLTDAEVARFLRLGQTTPAGSPDEVAEATLLAFLVSPSFLLLPELSTEEESTGGGIELSAHEVAARLSFLIWGSIPDAELDAAADRDELRSEEQIVDQARRMIAVRDKTGPMIASFHRAWTQMNNGNAHWWKGDHDPDAYPQYSADAKPSLRAELDAFFEDVAFRNGTFRDLLLSNVAYVNRDNAAIYDLEADQYGADLTRVELDADRRPGFLTRAGFLSSYAGYDATSPILRGAFIAVYMLGVNPGAPIPGAAMMTVSGDFETQRAYVEELTRPDSCAGCHAVINPPGFVLENYDAIGRWQTVDPRGGPIDAIVTSAVVDFGEGRKEMIRSPLQLMQEIAETPKARQLYAQAWVAYAYGRDPNASDGCVVEGLEAKLSNEGYGILDLIADLTRAPSFRLRVRETP